MIINDAVKGVNEKKIAGAWDKADEILASQHANQWRVELPILRGDTPTFMEYPLALNAEDLKGTDAVVLGIPFEGVTALSPTTSAPPTCGRPGHDSVYWRMGAEKPESLDMIRKYSIFYSHKHNRGWFPEIHKEMCIDDYIKVKDYGDTDYDPAKIQETIDKAEARVADIVAAGAVPIVFGGDHTDPIPTMKAVLKPRKEKVGLIVFDSHLDLCNDPLNWASSQWYQAFELGKIDPSNFVEIGMRGVRNGLYERNVAKGLGHRYITIDEIKDRGIKDVMDEALAIATDGTDGIYMSLDIDVMEPSAVCSQKAPEIWGMTTDEMFHAIRRISREKIIGVDINEYSADYDFNGMGAQWCARVAIEFLGGMAVSMGFSLSPIEIIPFLWYLELLAVFAIISIFVPHEPQKSDTILLEF